MRGIYITANDKFIEQAIALLNSIRHYDPHTPITLIPYDENYEAIAGRLTHDYGVKLYGDLAFIERLSQQLYTIFGEGFFARPNQFRKQACWFGEYDEFLYIDTDIVVFERIIDNLDALAQYDFLCCDYQHRGGISNVFNPTVFETGTLAESDRAALFNCGWWAAKKNLFTEDALYRVFAECAAHPDYFDFSQKTSDQPIINYLILKSLPPERRFNLVNRPGGAPGSWAGSRQFERQGDRLFDPNCNNQPLQYLHWAGIRLAPGCPYWDIWQHYRYLNGDERPAEVAQLQPQTPSKFTRLKQHIKTFLRRS
ncbi:MAG: methionine synthase [Spirulina sp. SIO3F2]|nr:methionine synthase [Spirulina sp. SIO3F2]